jgi:hypothetical protein
MLFKMSKTRELIHHCCSCLTTAYIIVLYFCFIDYITYQLYLLQCIRYLL